jgi:hypothetical protein
MFLNRIKERVGLTLEAYDHHRTGYSASAMQSALEKAGFRNIRTGSYCRFFSESIELVVNAVYLRMRRRKDEGAEERNVYRPRTQSDLQATGKAYVIYRMVYPLLRLVSLLDVLVPFTRGYVLVASGER